MKRALISVSDKAELADFCRPLVEQYGVELVSTGGTARLLRDAGLPVVDVSAVTGFPEMLDGRVKTLHPRIHAAVLADRHNPEHQRQLREHDIAAFDLLVVNLYPFEQTTARAGVTVAEAIEQIDIGGPALLRAAAKNFAHGPAAVTDLAVFGPLVLDELRRCRADGRALDLSPELRLRLAQRVWQDIARYDAAIAAWFDGLTASSDALAHHRPAAAGTDSAAQAVASTLADWAEAARLPGGGAAAPSVEPLRYGENSHQQAWLVRAKPPADEMGVGPHGRLGSLGPVAVGRVLQGSMSYNNLVDADAGVQLVNDVLAVFNAAGDMAGPSASGAPTVSAIIKHTNACGIALSLDAVSAYESAYKGDVISAAGGVLVMSSVVTESLADAVMNSFSRWGRERGAGFFKLDVWVAPRFDDAALRLITAADPRRKWGREVRLLEVGHAAVANANGSVGNGNVANGNGLAREPYTIRSIGGGLLVQTADRRTVVAHDWQPATSHRVSEQRMADLRLAWLIAKHAKSNAIVLCRDAALLGAGVGQTSRVESCRLAIDLAKAHGHSDKLAGAVAASDAFFPVPDGPTLLAEAGICAIAHPGGSTRDDDTRQLCDLHGISLWITGSRHFRH